MANSNEDQLREKNPINEPLSPSQQAGKLTEEIEGIQKELGNIQNYEFVKQGEMLEPKLGVFICDVGNGQKEGIADHHQIKGGETSAAGLIEAHPELILEWDAKQPITKIITHANPDFDACASAFLIKNLVEKGELPPHAQEISKYADQVDYAKLKIGSNPSKTPYGIMAGIMQKTQSYFDVNQKKWIDKSSERMVRAMELMEWISENGLDEAAFSKDHPFEEEEKLIKEDYKKYEEDLKNCEKHIIKIKDQEGKEREVDLAIIRNPKSALFKDWFRNDIENSRLGRGFEYLLVITGNSENGERFIASVAPDRGMNLEGLGALLDKEETEARGGKEKDERYKDKPREGYDNADPWYDGRAHNYTIIDTPRSGTKLTVEQVIEIIKNPSSWQK